MPMYTCSVCGENAYSKCVHSRNVFPDTVEATIIRMFMCVVQPEGYAEDRFEARIDFTIQDNETKADALARQLRMILNNKEVLPIVLCNHKWEMQAELCDLECCHKS